MKLLYKFFVILFIFFITLNTNTVEANLDLQQPHKSEQIIQLADKENSIYNKTSQDVKYLVPISRTTDSIIFQKNNGNDFNFGGFKDNLAPTNIQFKLLLSYIYNKSYLIDNRSTQNKLFLTEISPNAP